jgi:hypothetical protein
MMQHTISSYVSHWLTLRKLYFLYIIMISNKHTATDNQNIYTRLLS